MVKLKLIRVLLQNFTFANYSLLETKKKRSDISLRLLNPWKRNSRYNTFPLFLICLELKNFKDPYS